MKDHDIVLDPELINFLKERFFFYIIFPLLIFDFKIQYNCL